MTALPSAGDYEIAQARGAAYGLVSHGFQYPDRDLVDTLADPARWFSWPDVLHQVDPESARHLAAVRASLGATGSWVPLAACPPVNTCKQAPPPQGAARGTPVEPAELQGTFNALFGHAVRGKCPPYELEYGRSEIIQQAFFLADVAGFYAAFGMEVNHDADDRADHISVETEFLSVLCAKEAHAIEERHADHRDISTKAQRDFLKDHLACWLPAFTLRVQQADSQGFYGALARFAAAFVAGECRRFRITVGRQTLELRPTDPHLDTSISCGPGDAAHQLIQLTPGAGPDRDP